MSNPPPIVVLEYDAVTKEAGAYPGAVAVELARQRQRSVILLGAPEEGFCVDRGLAGGPVVFGLETTAMGFDIKRGIPNG